MVLPVCRVCLADDVSHSVRDVHLRETYERLAGAKFYRVDEMRVNLCYFCYWQLRKFRNFTEQARSSHKILKEAIKYGEKVGLQYIKNAPKKRHLSISTIKTLTLEGNNRTLSKKKNLSISNIKTLSLEGNNRTLPKKKNLSISTIKTLSLDGSIKKKSSTDPLKNKAKKMIGEYLNDSLEPLSANIQNLKSTVKNGRPSSLEFLLRGNPELIIKKHKRPEKFEIVKQKNIEIETRHNENGKLSPNKIQSTEKNAESGPQMIEEYIDVNYDKHDDDETLYPCHKINKILLTEKNLAEHNKNHSKEKGSYIKETKIGTKIFKFEKRKKNADGFNQLGGQVSRPAADISPDIVFSPGTDTSSDIQNLDMVAEFLEIESDEIINSVHLHTDNTRIKTPSIQNVSKICDIETNSENIYGTHCASKLDSTTGVLENVTNELIYKCSFCKNLFSTKEKLDNHEKTHTRSIVNRKIKRFKCKECGQKFLNSMHLEGHSRRHTKERPFTCEICGKSFMTFATLQTHFKVHTKPKHVCHICNKSFHSRGYMINYHMNAHFNIRPYVCHVCNKAFHQTGALWEHIRTVHQGVKRYECEICSFKFGCKSHLARHMLTHSGVKAFSCDYCKMDFATRSDMRRHVTLYCKKK